MMSAGISWSLLASEHPPVFRCWYLWLIDLHYFLTLSESRGPFLLVWPSILPEVTISSDGSMCSSSLLLTHPMVFAVRSPRSWISIPLFDLLDFNTGSFHTENSWSTSVCVCVCVQMCPICNPIDWNPPESYIGADCLFLLQGIFLMQGSNLHLLCLPHWQKDSLSLHHLGSPTEAWEGQINFSLSDPAALFI